MKHTVLFLVLLFILGSFTSIVAQELAPRAYLWAPKNTTTAVAGFAF